ncbi:hypothetical protein M432DRAFT_666678 [Thermoascus aurantiacus ATCC 26904]
MTPPNQNKFETGVPSRQGPDEQYCNGYKHQKGYALLLLCLWLAILLIKGIIFAGNGSRRPFLSGVGRFDAPVRSPGIPEFYPSMPSQEMEDPVSNDQRLFGYPMHQTCWLFLEKILGKIEEADLPHLMTAFKLLWDGGHVDVEKNAALPTNPMKIPSLHSLIHRFMKPPRKSQKSVDAETSVIQHIPTAFDNFPLELLYCVLDYLSAKEVRQFLLSFGLTIPEAYWMGRFQDDLMYEVAAYEPSRLDWKILCLRTEAILERGSCHSLTYRARIFGILKILRTEFLRIRSRNGTSNPVLSDWIVTFRSAWNANVFTQSLYIPPVVDEVYFSFVGGTGGYLLSGIKIYPGGIGLLQTRFLCARMGHCSPSRCNLTDACEARFSGRLNSQALVAMGCQSRREPGTCSNPEPHTCMRTSRLWELSLPPQTVNLNENIFTNFGYHYLSSHYGRPARYRHLTHFIFGDERGELLPFLRSVKGYYDPNTGGALGLHFCYSSDKMRCWNVEDGFFTGLDFRTGEIIAEVEVICLREPGYSWRGRKMSRAQALCLRLITNRSRSLDVGGNRGHKFQNSYYRKRLRPREGEKIIGLFAEVASDPRSQDIHKGDFHFNEFGIITAPCSSLSSCLII